MLSENKTLSQKFIERNIQPTPRAWDRIEKQILLHRKNRRQKKILLWYVAASFTGAAMIGSLLYHSYPDNEFNPIVKQRLAEPIPGYENKNQSDRRNIFSGKKIIEDRQISLRPTHPKTSMKPKDDSILVEKNPVIIQTLALNESAIKMETPANIVSRKRENFQLEKPIAVADEAEILLGEARSRIADEKSSVPNTVNASDLLIKIEFRNNFDSRDRIISLLGEGYAFIKKSMMNNDNF